MTPEQVDNYRNFLRSMGLGEEEIERSINAIIDYPTPDAFTDFSVTGIDLMPQIDPLQVPDTGSPPVFIDNFEGNTDWIPSVGYESQPTPDPLGSVKTHQPHYDPQGSNIGHTYNIINPEYEGDLTNWFGGSAHEGMETPTVGVEGAVPDMAWKYPVEDSQVQIPEWSTGIEPSDGHPLHEVEETVLARFEYNTKEDCKICKPFNGKIYDLHDLVHRPIIPSEGLGYTTTHPNCTCTWRILATTKKKLSKLTKKQQRVSTNIKSDVTRKANKHELHTVFPDGRLSKRTRGTNPMREALAEVRSEFKWLSDDYLLSAKEIANKNEGTLYLIRAAKESITDHRGEGEKYRRLLSGGELALMTRTAINKGMDINHNNRWRTEALILDSEYDPIAKEIQMIVLEKDEEINRAIDNGQITAVSINGGSPRTQDVQPCNHDCSHGECELCNVPKGVVLGELDDIAMTWVATSPMVWKGIKIPKAVPGIKVTAIQKI